MKLKFDDVLEVRKNLIINVGWEECGTYAPDLVVGDQLVFGYFYFTEGCYLNFSFVDGRKDGPEFTPEEVQKFLKDGTLIIVEG